jgi:hypothetical protein
VAKFDPKEHLMTVKGGAQYLEVKWRLVWFREQFPNGVMVTEPIEITPQQAIFKATVTAVDDEGKVRGSATGYKTCTPAQFKFGYVEKAETGALGRALACLGFGTQFEPEFDEGEMLADSPVTPQQPPQAPKQPRNAPKPANTTPDTNAPKDMRAEALGRTLHGLADHDFLHAIAVQWGFESFANVPADNRQLMLTYLNGKGEDDKQAAFNRFRTGWEGQNQRSAMKQAELLPGTDAVPNPDRFTS